MIFLFLKEEYHLLLHLRVKDRFKLTEALVVDPLYLQHSYSDKAIDYRVGQSFIMSCLALTILY
jgi:hypothetical protein